MALSPDFRNKLRDQKQAHRQCMRELGTMVIGEQQLKKGEVRLLAQMFGCMNRFDYLAMRVLNYRAGEPEDPDAT